MPNISDFMQEGEDSELLENAIDSIKLGIEDFKNSQPSRLLSAIRNFHSGVLLLCKEALRRLCPKDSNEVHIKEKQQAVRAADGKIIFVGLGKRTVNEYQIEERFKNLKMNIDLSGLKKLTEIRNEIEHYYTTKQRHLMEEAFAAALPIVREILIKELNSEPVALLGDETWSFLVEHAKLYKEEEARCRESLNTIDWGTDTLGSASHKLACSNCGSSLIKQKVDKNKNYREMQLICTQCGTQLDWVKTLEKGVEEVLFTECYLSQTQGGEYPLETCPECQTETYVVEEGQCVLCDFTVEGQKCAVCRVQLSPEEYDLYTGLCSYHAHVASKDD